MSRVVAAIDCGTNTIRLLVASRASDGRLVEHDRRLSFVGLGQGVDATGRFDPVAVQRTLNACDQFAAVIADDDVDAIRFVATSAARDAANRELLIDGVRSRLGVEPEVISGDEESRLSFRGALSGVRHCGDPVLVMDAGGGSTELVRGRCTGDIELGQSIDIGSRRVRERYLRHDPPSADEIADARAEVNRMLDGVSVDLDGVRTFIGVAGTVTTMAALAQGLMHYDRSRVHGYAMSRRQVAGLTERLLGSTVAEVAAMGAVQAQRAEVLCGGALVVNEVMSRLDVPQLIASEADILDGIALSLLD